MLKNSNIFKKINKFNKLNKTKTRVLRDILIVSAVLVIALISYMIMIGPHYTEYMDLSRVSYDPENIEVKIGRPEDATTAESEGAKNADAVTAESEGAENADASTAENEGAEKADATTAESEGAENDKTIFYVYCVPEGVVEISDTKLGDSELTINMKGLKKGETSLRVKCVGDGASVQLFESDTPIDKNEATIAETYLKCNSSNKIENLDTLNFAGQRGVLFALLLYSIFVVGLMLNTMIAQTGHGRFSYESIYCAGVGIFSIVTMLVEGFFMVASLVHPEKYTVFYMLDMLTYSGYNFMILSLPVVLFVAIGLIVSNLALLKHERKRPQNMLGILLGIILLFGEAFGFWWQKVSLPDLLWLRVDKTCFNIYAMTFVYVEAMLLGTMFCAFRASRWEPEKNKEYVIILGCKIRPDGTLYPLLKSRVDRAIEFYKKQLEETGKVIKFVPSGGKGPDEVMAEAEAMRNYLLSQGIPEDHILVENKSLNTYQNMQFSKNIIEEDAKINSGEAPLEKKKDGNITAPGNENSKAGNLEACGKEKAKAGNSKILFSTNGYHVLRSHFLARSVHLHAEGIGAPTKWYFWPNALIRETVGMFVRKIPENAIMLLIGIIIFGALSFMYT